MSCDVKRTTEIFELEGSRSLRASCVIRRILNSLLNFTGSWSRETKTWEMQSLLVEFVDTLAAAFWINWRIFSELFGHPAKMPLQWCNLDVTKAWTFLFFCISLGQNPSEFGNTSKMKRKAPLDICFTCGLKDLRILVKKDSKVLHRCTQDQ